MKADEKLQSDVNIQPKLMKEVDPIHLPSSSRLLTQVVDYFQYRFCSIKQASDYLKSKQLITQIPFQQFIERIANCFEKIQDCIQIISNEDDHQKETKGQESKHMVPFPCRNSPLFLEQVCCWFYKEYLQKFEAKQLIDLGQKQKEQHIDQGFYEFQQAQMKANFGLFAIFQNHNEQKISKINKCTKENVKSIMKNLSPQNFFQVSRGTPRLQVRPLLYVELSQIFTEQLEEVKKIVLKQLSDEHGYLTQTYYTFLCRYQFYKFIKEGQYENEESLIDLKAGLNIQDYQKYLSRNNVRYFGNIKSSLLKYWEHLLKIIQPQFDFRHRINLKYLFQKEIKHIFIYYSPAWPQDNKMSYLRKDRIFININHFKGSLTIDEIRSGPLKPYLLLCIYHELAHLLIRDFKRQGRIPLLQQALKAEEEHDHELDLSSDSVGCAIIKIIKKNIVEVQKAFKDRIEGSDDFDQKRMNAEFIDDKVSSIVQYIRKHSNIKKCLQARFSISKQVQKKINALQYVHTKIVYASLKKKMSELTVDFLQTYKQKFKEDLSKEKQVEYEFVKAVFLSLQDLNRLPIDKDYLLAKGILQQGGSFYFKSSNSIIEETLQHIRLQNKDINFASREAQYFVEIYSQKQPIKTLGEQLETLTQDLKLEEFDSFNKRMAAFINFSTPPGYRFQKYKLFKEQLLLKTLSILEAQKVYRECMSYLKFSEVFKIASQLPDFIFYGHEHGRDAGFYFEDMLLPTLRESGLIYAKDFELLKNLRHENAQEVGKAPQSDTDKRQSMGIHRAKSDREAPILSMRSFKQEFYGGSLHRPFEDMLNFKRQDCKSQEQYESLQKTFQSVIEMRCHKHRKAQNPQQQ